MEIRDLLTRGVTLIVDPRGLKTSLDDFFASYGGYLEYVIAVAKDTSGRVFYSSKVAPVDDDVRVAGRDVGGEYHLDVPA